MRMAQNGRETTQALLRSLQRLGRMSSKDASRLEQLVTDKDQPIIELLEHEGIITQRDLAVLLGETLQLPLVRRVHDAISHPESRLSQTATRVAIAMVLEDALAKLASGVMPEIPSEPARQHTISPPPPATVVTSGQREPAAPAPAARSFRALVVDDDPDSRCIVRSAIERSGLGLTVITAQDADEALALIELDRPDVVVLDLSMPRIDGFEVCRRLRRAAHTKVLPVLILSATDSVDSKTRATAVGADDYVVKPFQRDDFIARIRGLIERGHGANGAAVTPT